MAVFTALAGMVLCAAPGVAAARDWVTLSTPTVTGTPTSEQVLTGHATWDGNPSPTVSFRWVRCSAGSSHCSFVDGAEGQTYTLTDADVGRQLIFIVIVRNRGDFEWKQSAATKSIAAKPPVVTPTPTPTPDPEPTPDPAPAPSPVPAPVVTMPRAVTDIVPPDVTTPAAPAGGVQGAGAALRWLSPFPLVRIRGFLTGSGAKVTLLTVRAPRGAHIRVRCSGRGCPRKRYARSTALLRLKPYQQLLRGNLRLEISVTRKGYVGKRTIITLRRDKAPTRRDLCLYPGARKAKACKAG